MQKAAAIISPNQSQVKSSTVQSNAAISEITNDKILIDLFITIPCANGGVGEDVLLSGFLHVVTKVTINGNRFHVNQHFQPQGISGIGQTTGDKYQATGVTQDDLGFICERSI